VTHPEPLAWIRLSPDVVITHAPGNGAPIGGLKVVAKSGWFAARPSGTESIYKISAESFEGADHLRRVLEDAQALVDDALAAAPQTDDAGRPADREQPAADV